MTKARELVRHITYLRDHENTTLRYIVSFPTILTPKDCYSGNFKRAFSRLHQKPLIQEQSLQSMSRDWRQSASMTTLSQPSQAPLIHSRLKIFLKRRLLDILEHLPAQQHTILAKRTRRALSKLKQDQFGICEQCDHPIAIDRILADPAVERCGCCEHGINCPVDHPFNPASKPASS